MFSGIRAAKNYNGSIDCSHQHHTAALNSASSDWLHIGAPTSWTELFFFFLVISSDNYERGQQTAFVRLDYGSLAVSARMRFYEQKFRSYLQILFKDLM